MTKSAHHWSWSCDLHGWPVGSFFLEKILQKAIKRPTKVQLFPYKQVSGRNGADEWLRITNAFILCDLVWKVKKSHAEQEALTHN